MTFKEVYQADLNRFGGGIDNYTKTWLLFYRKTQFASNRIIKKLYHVLLFWWSERHGIEVDYHVKCGPGLYIGHPHGITINYQVVMGKNVNIHKNVTIGRENRGTREGTPTIGNEVWIGIGSTVVGNITIGDDVLIAPNSFVNCDIPDHSIVIGNPCKIIHRDNATEGYINNKV